MTHQDFINKWNGKYQERRDPTNKNQCFDLVVGYVVDVLGLPENTFTGLLNAYQIFINPTELTSKNFDFIKNTPFAVPRKGDIIVWGKEYNNTAGHVAVVHEADVNSFTAFSQNDPTGSPCILKKYMYNTVLGWLRHVVVPAGELDACLKAHAQAVKSADEAKALLIQKEAEWKATEKRLREEKDFAVREGERKLAEYKKQCQMEKVEDRKRLINLITEHLRSLSELK